MLVTVVICTYERYELLEEVVGAVIGQDLSDSDYQIIVVDNSPDAARSRKVAERWGGLANLAWRHEPKTGLSHARNTGLKLARTPFVAYLDDDAVADAAWLRAMLAAFEELGPDIHAIGGRVRLRLEGGRPGWLDDRLLSYLSACDLGDEVRRIGPAEWVVGANIAYRTAALRATGGFSTALGRVGDGASLMSNEETDVQGRLAARGGATGYAPAACVEHIVAAARLRQDWFRKRAAWQAVSDFVRAPRALQADGQHAWARSKGFLARRAPSERTLRGLALFEPSAPRFHAQMCAIYDSVHAVLAGMGEDHEG